MLFNFAGLPSTHESGVLCDQVYHDLAWYMSWLTADIVRQAEAKGCSILECIYRECDAIGFDRDDAPFGSLEF